MAYLSRNIAVLAVLLITKLASAQFSGSNMAEFQYGKLPGDSTASATLYDRFVASYDYKAFRASATLEQFNSPLPGSSYIRPSQLSLQYLGKNLEVKAGNFYETLGRGTLLRSFQVKGAVLEDLSYRAKHYFHRDILGASVRYRHKNFVVKALGGKPLNYVFPPTQGIENRRPDAIGALYSEYSLREQTLGAALMQHQNGGTGTLYGMATLSGSITPLFSYYTEIAKDLSGQAIGDFSDQASYAIYTGINLSFGSFGLSAEYKNYQNFLIGSGINEPPALIKEHSYKVLNRSTHVLQPSDETGYQFEAFYTFPNLSTLTFNNALAVNDLGGPLNFYEYFLEYTFYVAGVHDVRLFADYAEDPVKLEEKRISAGAYADWMVLERSTIQSYLEFQTFERLGGRYFNLVSHLGYAHGSKIAAGLIGEASNDSFVVSEGWKIWLGANLSYQINNKHKIQLFAGERRGGPACNAGVCYEVLDFKGVELRLTSRF